MCESDEQLFPVAIQEAINYFWKDFMEKQNKKSLHGGNSQLGCQREIFYCKSATESYAFNFFIGRNIVAHLSYQASEMCQRQLFADEHFRENDENFFL